LDRLQARRRQIARDGLSARGQPEFAQIDAGRADLCAVTAHGAFVKARHLLGGHRPAFQQQLGQLDSAARRARFPSDLGVRGTDCPTVAAVGADGGFGLQALEEGTIVMVNLPPGGVSPASIIQASAVSK
jgi:hypothetical protein